MYSASKTSGVLRGAASGANRCYVLAHCGGRGYIEIGFSFTQGVLQMSMLDINELKLGDFFQLLFFLEFSACASYFQLKKTYYPK